MIDSTSGPSSKLLQDESMCHNDHNNLSNYSDGIEACYKLLSFRYRSCNYSRLPTLEGMDPSNFDGCLGQDR